ncbi:putative short-chain dehydrogenase/reductase [Aphanomyces cochlioides]|nr:putative short-chain dehydrogenase/reductase [Aphanomyces cochlioides]
MAPELHALFEKFEQLDQTKPQTLAQDWLAAAQGNTSEYKWPDVASPIGPYGTSKTMVIAVTRKWAADHPEIKTMMVCPGWCATDLNNNNGPRQATQGGESVVFPIFNPDVTSTGGFYRDGLVHSFNTPRPAPKTTSRWLPFLQSHMIPCKFQVVLLCPISTGDLVLSTKT